MSILSELKRRNVLRAGAAYLAASWLIIQIADTLIPIFELPAAASRIVVVALAIGFVPALLAAWLFEFTPEGLKRESGAIHASAGIVRATRRLDRAIIGVLVLALVVFAVDRFLIIPGRDVRQVSERGEPSIAVLAFDDLSPDGDLEYFSDGVSIELMELLTKIPNLRVIARESAFWFKGRDATYAEIGAKLGVGRLLEGTVRVAGDQVRVTASLIDPGTEEQVWSYSPGARPITDVFAIQAEIATEVVEELQIALSGQLPALDQTTPDVHSLYLQARHILATDVKRIDYARELLEDAVARDPSFFPAHNSLALAYYYLSVTPGFDRTGNLQRWVSTSEQAALRWPDRPEIKAFRALQAFLNEDYATAAQYLERSLRQDPSPSEPWAMALNLLNVLNRNEDAVEVGEYVLMRDPICGPCYQALSRSLFALRRFDDAVAVYVRADNLGFEMPADFWHAMALLLSGDAEAALAEFQRDTDYPPASLAGSAMAFNALGRTADFEQALAELDGLAETRPDTSVVVAMVYAFIGDIDRAVEILNEAPQLGAQFASDPMFDALREHPRYEELLAKTGIWPDDWRESIRFEVPLPE